MAALEEDVFDELGFEAPEGVSEFFDEEAEFDDYDGFEDEFDDEDAFEEEAYFDDEFDEEGFDDYDAFDEDYADEGEEALEEVMAFALDAEDDDEFLGKVWSGGKRIAKRAAPVVGKIARVAAPILRHIPHPYAQIAARGAQLLSRLRAEGASEEEALEAFAELAVHDKRALPIVAGLTARTVLKNKGARMSYGARKKAVKDIHRAAKVLVNKRGRTAVRALPKIAKRVKHTPAPAKAKAAVVKRTALKVAKSPVLAKKLSKPSPVGKHLVKKLVKMRSYTIPGPARITISGV